MRYPIVLYKGDDSGYSVIVPDLEGCFSAGDNYDDALLNSKEAIELHILGILNEVEQVPEPSLMEGILKTLDNEALLSYVTVDINKLKKELNDKAVRVNITFPNYLLNKVDTYCEENKIPRARWLQELAEKALKGIDKPF